MAWIYLVVAGLMEIVWAISLSKSEGFTKLWPSVSFFAFAVGSMYLLSLALRTIPVGTGYAIWTGIGAAGTALIGMFFLDESKDPLKIGSLILIIVGIVGLRLTGEGH